MAPTEADRQEIVRQINELVWGEGRLDLVDQYVAETYREHNNAAPKPIEGPDGYKENVQMARRAFPDMEVTTEDLIVEGNKVVNHYTITGTHTGPMMGVDPTGREVRFSGIALIEFEDGQIVEDWSNIDVLGLMRQIGALDGG